MQALAFLDIFRQKTAQVHIPERTQLAWTLRMRPLLWSIGDEHGFKVRCENFTIDIAGTPQLVGHGEVKEMDFAYFAPSSTDQSSPNSASVLIEHENSHQYLKAQEDFGKLCKFDVPLRVFIGYGKTEKYAIRDGKRLIGFFNENNLLRITDGETLVIMGWRQKAPQDRQWRASMLKSKGDWAEV